MTQATSPRHQAHSPFATILQRLVESSPGAVGAALADEEGETVDYYGDVDADDLKLAAAYMGILLRRIGAIKPIEDSGGLDELRIAGEDGQIVGRNLGLGYYVTVQLRRFAILPKLDDALDQATAELRIEAGGVFD